MTTRYAAGPGAGITPAAPTLPPDPFAPRPWLRGRPAVFVLASLIVALLASSAAPTPLYAIYQAQWHFTPITTTVVFGVYALAVLASLLTLGKLSDHVGRRPVLLTALAVHAGSLVIFATATGGPELHWAGGQALRHPGGAPLGHPGRGGQDGPPTRLHGARGQRYRMGAQCG